MPDNDIVGSPADDAEIPPVPADTTTETAEATASAEKKEQKDRSPFGWFVHHTLKWFWSVLKRRPKTTIFLTVLIVFLTYYLRWEYQPYVLHARIYLGAVIVTILMACLLVFLTRKRARWSRFSIVIVGTVLVAIGLSYLQPVNKYIALYWRYQSLHFVDLSSLPLTAKERILPLNAVHTLTSERMDKSEVQPTVPNLVRVKDEYRWTMGIEPSKFENRLLGHVGEIANISATIPSPDFSRGASAKVYFPTGENMYLSNNLESCVTRSFGLWRFLNYEPGEPLYMEDDKGEWVQVVPLVKWVGVFFPWPEFGGVQVIRQFEPSNMVSHLLDNGRRALSGCGEFIPAKDVQKHAFLRGQNLLPPEVSRYIAESVRFQGGLDGPLPWVHRGDIRIPDLSTDVNPQPFTLCFIMPDEKKCSALYQYFGLEPFDPDKQGLSASLFLPADGSKHYYRYRHADRGAKLIGVSAVGAKIRESKKNYDWSRFKPVEYRPYVHKIPDAKGVVKPRWLWMGTIVAVKEGKHGENTHSFIAGSTPEIDIVDAARGNVVSVDSLDPADWDAEIAKKLGKIWAQRQE